MDKRKILYVSILVLLMAWYGLFFVHKIDLTTSDLGRHIKNGELVLDGDFGILSKNFYSYTEPIFPVVNHHWGGGVIFSLIEKMSGFAGLAFFYLILSLAVFWLFFKVSEKESGLGITTLVSLFLIPLMAARTEIRPEIFSYFFIALFFWILWRWRKGELNAKWLFLLPVLEIIWVNTHIYFIFGPALIGLFLFERFVLPSQRIAEKIKKLGLILGLTGLATLINPFGLKGLLYPFGIFRDYGYRIVENQSVWFLEKLGIVQNPNLLLFEIAFAILVLSFILLWMRKKFNLIYLILAIVFSALGWLAIRNFTIFGLIALPIISYNLKRGLNLRAKFKSEEYRVVGVFLGLVILLFTFVNHSQRLPFGGKVFGWGLLDYNNQSARFFKGLNIKGPVFNNYDIGGYLIYHLYPQEKVFTDNRPEAYSVPFFEELYVPMQQDNSFWQEKSKEYNFNVIFFNYHDATPWAQNFLAERVKDNSWAPVYVDNHAIIFLKRNLINQPIIEKYEMPKSRFGM